MAVSALVNLVQGKEATPAAEQATIQEQYPASNAMLDHIYEYFAVNEGGKQTVRLVKDAYASLVFTNAE